MNATFLRPIIRTGFALMMVSLSFGLSPGASWSQQAPAKPGQATLAAILEATAKYCEAVKEMALFFVCTERVSEKENFFTRGPRGARSMSSDILRVSDAKTRTFVYEYQIIKVKDDIRENRILIEEDGQKRHQEDAELTTLKISARNVVYGPVGFFSRYWQDQFRYEVLGREPLGRKEAIVVSVVPAIEREENNNRGRAWIGAEDFRILRLELEPPFAEDSAVLMGDQNAAVGAKYYRHITWTIDYGVETKGILFPSRQTIREWYRSDTGFSTIKREVVFDYSNYKFFTVEVSVKLH
jgi:hypothetical protein